MTVPVIFAVNEWTEEVPRCAARVAVEWEVVFAPPAFSPIVLRAFAPLGSCRGWVVRAVIVDDGCIPAVVFVGRPGLFFVVKLFLQGVAGVGWPGSRTVPNLVNVGVQKTFQRRFWLENKICCGVIAGQRFTSRMSLPEVVGISSDFRGMVLLVVILEASRCRV